MTGHRHLLRLTALLLSVASATSSGAQRPGTALLLGRVTVDSTRQLVAGAEVLIPSLSLRAITDSLGRFRIEGVFPGRRGLRVNRLGYAPLRTAVEFSSGDTVEMEIGLTPSAEEMAAIEIVARQNASRTMLDFERRRASGTGVYLTADDIQRRHRGRLAEALRTMGGVNILTGSTGGTYLVGARADRASTCFTAVMLDGSWAYDGDRYQAPFDVNSIRPDDVAAVEYYRGLSNTPVELQGIRNSCGVLVIWTK
ncbi:MAG: TonB-dependent receptor [Gemmatimonadetes bacterium]|nr:TonB-dependent receptor [Gemmatimonadota bacterium]